MQTDRAKIIFIKKVVESKEQSSLLVVAMVTGDDWSLYAFWNKQQSWFKVNKNLKLINIIKRRL